MGSDDASIDTEFYSAKKNKTTVTLLIIMDINGRIIYISASFGGIHADRVLTIESKDQWHTKLAKDENGLKDLGFAGLREEGLRIDTPPRDHELTLYKEFSSVRIRIEQKIADAKDWRCCKDTIRTPPAKRRTLLNLHHKHWTICCVFTNMKNGFF
jgi:hypothetical protein